jgi:hypothetical protein
MAKRKSDSNQGQFERVNGRTSVVVALMLSITSTSVAAQSDFEFIDPLEEMRTKIESNSNVAAPIPKSPPPAPPEPSTLKTDAGPTVDVKGPVTVFAERLGLPTAGLVGLGVLALLALVLGLMWLIGRRKSSKLSQRNDRELYAISDGARGRRTLESGAQVTRNRKKFLDTTEEAELNARPSAASKAAQIISGNEAADDGYGDDYVNAFEPEQQQSEAGKTAMQADDPNTWRRPNLDRLKDSIRKDWAHKDDEEKDPEVEELRGEAKVFADLFGDDEAPSSATTATAATAATAAVATTAAAATASAAQSPALDMLDTVGDEQEPMSVSTLQTAVEKSAGGLQNKAERVARDNAPDRADALRRIKALRESVRAS